MSKQVSKRKKKWHKDMTKNKPISYGHWGKKEMHHFNTEQKYTNGNYSRNE